jgi:hypothetical protein
VDEKMANKGGGVMYLGKEGVKVRRIYINALIDILGEKEVTLMMGNEACLGALNVMANNGPFDKEHTANLLSRIVGHYLKHDTEAFRRILSADSKALEIVLAARKST